MTPVLIPTEYSFVRNPVRFEFTTDSGVMRIFNITFGTETFAISVHPYKVGLTTWKLSFDISDLLANLVRLTYDATLTLQINLPNFVNSYTVTETVSAYSFTAKVIPGGLSKEFQKFLIQQKIDAFEYRFLNPLANWLLTTRTDGNLIRMSRKELACLFFLSPSAETIFVHTNTGEGISIASGAVGIACMLNLPVWLATSTSGGLASEIYFSVGQIPVITIKITDNNSEESNIIKFRNSLGVYEFIEVNGTGKRTPSYGEDTSFNVFDAELNDFKKARNRVTATNNVTVDSGYKSQDDMYFIGDMLQANAMWFISGLKKQKCLVTSDNYSMQLLKTTPESVSLKIEPVNSERYYSPMTDIDTVYTLLATENDEFIITEDNYFIEI
jgi:hypothetical protein